MLLYLYLTLLLGSFSKSLCLINKRIRFPGASLAMQVPEDLSFEDKISEIVNIANIGEKNFLIPNTDVHPINGAENLGTLLWAVVTFYGLFTTAGKPAEWVIPGIVSALGGEMKDGQWYKDFESGYSYETPVLVDAFRLALFLILGFYFNAFVDYIFDQDAFWGWSSGACLAIPSLLLNASREKRPSRQVAETEEQVKSDFSAFVAERITLSSQVPVVEVDEARLLIEFRRFSTVSRSAEEVTDRTLRRIARKSLGMKPSKQGKYRGIELRNLRKEAKDALEKSMRLASQLRKEQKKTMSQQSFEEVQQGDEMENK